jgi:hydrogenase nickel incorporation protein HypA/HybF
MHEFHLMAQIVKAVEAGLQGAAQGKPLLVRLKIQAQSHLLAQDQSTLQTAFTLAAQGTRAEGAKLEIIPVSGDAWCSHCKTDVVAIGPDGACATCGGPVLAGQAAPEVMVHELVVEE